MNNLLNKEEKEEIKSDVKEAFNKVKPKAKSYKNSKAFIILTVVLIIFFSTWLIVWYITNDPRIN